MRLAFLLACILALTAASGQTARSETFTVLMTTGNNFDPENLTVAPGDSVVWYNADVIAHTTDSGADCTGDGMWDAELAPGEYFGLTMNDMGTFPYFCDFHCLMGMTGVITVEEPTGSQESTWGTVKARYR